MKGLVVSIYSALFENEGTAQAVSPVAEAVARWTAAHGTPPDVVCYVLPPGQADAFRERVANREMFQPIGTDEVL